MDKAILNLIEKKGGAALAAMTSTKAKTFRMAAYAGLRFYRDGLNLSEVADEIGYSDSGTHKLLAKWKEALSSGGVAANSIDRAYGARRVEDGPKAPQMPSTYATPEEAEERGEPDPAGQRTAYRGRLGFSFTWEEERRMMAAIRGSIRHFARFGKGRRARTYGEGYAPGRAGVPEAGDVWIIHDQAVSYCGGREEEMTAAAEAGEIGRRVYRRSSNHIYYEYSCSDLDKFIRERGLP